VDRSWEKLDEWGRAAVLRRSFKVHGAQHHPDIDTVLCSRCAHGLVYRRQSGNGEIRVTCGFARGPSRVPADIVECSGYTPRAETVMSLEEMTTMAHLIDPRDMPPSVNSYL
jgi:hypothetical protein